MFVATVGTGTGTSPTGVACKASDVMNYYDGNTITALWNYAQHLLDERQLYWHHDLRPVSPGAINLTSGDTGNVDMSHTANNPSIASATNKNADLTPDGKGGYSLTSDAQPYWDDCSTRDAVALTGKNIGDELNAPACPGAGSRAASGRPRPHRRADRGGQVRTADLNLHP